jgi:hypothetical protein
MAAKKARKTAKRLKKVKKLAATKPLRKYQALRSVDFQHGYDPS